MVKIGIISGFLGAGKTTLIKKLLEEAFQGEKTALIENEFGEVGIDGTILKNYGIEVKEMNSGCICCTIAGDFSLALKEILKNYKPDRVLIEPTGVGRLSDVIKGCSPFLDKEKAELNLCITVIDGKKYRMYLRNFSEFYKDQIINAKTIIISRTQFMKAEEVDSILEDIRKYNSAASIVTTRWDKLSGTDILELGEQKEQWGLEEALLLEAFPGEAQKAPIRVVKGKSLKEIHVAHQHADEVFSVWGKETAKRFPKESLKAALSRLEQAQGTILRAKGIVETEENRWIQFDYVPGEMEFRDNGTQATGKICVIGADMKEQELAEIFGL